MPIKSVLILFNVLLAFECASSFIPKQLNLISTLQEQNVMEIPHHLTREKAQTRLAMSLEQDTQEPSSLGPKVYDFAQTVTQSPLYTTVAQGAVVLLLLAGIDCGWSGDWSRFGYVSTQDEELARSIVTTVGSFHLFCAPIAVISTWQRQQPILPALMKVLLVGGLALGQVLFQPSNKAIQFPWKSYENFEGEPIEWAEKGSFVQSISKVSQVGAVASFKQAIADAVAGDYDKQAINDEIDGYIENNAVVMFSWQTCPFCKKAKQILIEDIGATVKVVELDEDKKVGNALRAELGKRTGRTSVPSIWIGGEYVGGCNDGPGIIPLEEGGELRPMLVSCGALKPAKTSRSNLSPFSFLDSLFQK